MSTASIQQQRPQQKQHKKCKSFRILRENDVFGSQERESNSLKRAISKNCNDVFRATNHHRFQGTLDHEKSEDFTVYQGGDVNEFFNQTNVPKHVSDVCLINDNYILVKMPETQICMENAIPTINGVEESMLDAEIYKTDEIMGSTVAIIPDKQNTCFTKKLSTYLNCHSRQNRISPARDEDMNESRADNLEKPSSSQCWIDSQKTSGRSNERHDGALKKEKPRLERCKNVDFVSKNSNSNTSLSLQDLEVKRNEESLRELQKSSSTSRGTRDIILEPKGFLEMPTVSEDPNGVCIETYPDYEAHTMKQKLLITSRRRSFKWSFNWFLRPFHSRKSKSKRSSSQRKKIHAVVCKTYFVRWTKPPEAEMASNSVTGLRRSRSAEF